MNVFSLFSGIGGLELGLERAGMTTVAQVEINPYCRRVLAKHWPEVPRHDDVRTCVDWWLAGPVADTDEFNESQVQASDGPVGGQRSEVGRWPIESTRPGAGGGDIAGDSAERVHIVGGGTPDAGPLFVPGRPTVDLVCGGFPCQPVSIAGQRLAQADPRWLWPAFHSVVRALRPRYVLVENVPGLLAAGMGDVLGDLAAIGYDAEWDRVPAAFVGAPHIRGRIFVVAYPAGTRPADQPMGSRRPPSASSTNGAVPADAQRDGVRLQPVAQLGRSGAAVAATDGQDRNVADADSPIGRISAPIFTGVSQPALPRAAQTGPGRRGGTDDWWAVEPDVGRVAHGIPRRLDRLRALGNAVVPQVAEHVGRLILATDQEVAA